MPYGVSLLANQKMCGSVIKNGKCTYRKYTCVSFKGRTGGTTGKDAQKNNIAAAKVVAETIKQLLDHMEWKKY